MHEMQESEVADQFVNSLDYPISKNSIVTAAREGSLSSTIHEVLTKVPDREFSNPKELSRRR